MLDYIPQMTTRQFKSCTGYSKLEYSILLDDFKLTFEQEYNCTYDYYINEHLNEEVEVKLPNLNSCLFFVLYQYKNDLIYDSLAVTFKMGTSTAHENFKRYSTLLEKTLEKKRNLSKT